MGADGTRNTNVKEYFNLEQMFYPNRIIINLDEQGNTAEMIIAPLIILSLIQNCCEQLLFSLQQKLTINISLNAENNRFHFGLRCNGYYENINGFADQASALNQALRRIQALYPGKHFLETNSQNGFFSIQLILEPEAIFIKPGAELKEKSIYETA